MCLGRVFWDYLSGTFGWLFPKKISGIKRSPFFISRITDLSQLPIEEEWDVLACALWVHSVSCRPFPWFFSRVYEGSRAGHVKVMKRSGGIGTADSVRVGLDAVIRHAPDIRSFYFRRKPAPGFNSLTCVNVYLWLCQCSQLHNKHGHVRSKRLYERKFSGNNAYEKMPPSNQSCNPQKKKKNIRVHLYKGPHESWYTCRYADCAMRKPVDLACPPPLLRDVEDEDNFTLVFQFDRGKDYSVDFTVHIFPMEKLLNLHPSASFSAEEVPSYPTLFFDSPLDLEHHLHSGTTQNPHVDVPTVLPETNPFLTSFGSRVEQVLQPGPGFNDVLADMKSTESMWRKYLDFPTCCKTTGFMDQKRRFSMDDNLFIRSPKWVLKHVRLWILRKKARTLKRGGKVSLSSPKSDSRSSTRHHCV